MTKGFMYLWLLIKVNIISPKMQVEIQILLKYKKLFNIHILFACFNKFI